MHFSYVGLPLYFHLRWRISGLNLANFINWTNSLDLDHQACVHSSSCQSGLHLRVLPASQVFNTAAKDLLDRGEDWLKQLPHLTVRTTVVTTTWLSNDWPKVSLGQDSWPRLAKKILQKVRPVWNLPVPTKELEISGSTGDQPGGEEIQARLTWPLLRFIQLRIWWVGQVEI